MADTTSERRTSNNPEDHMGLVYHAARLAKNQSGGDLEEWIGLCYEWLVNCCKAYRPEVGIAFSTYYCSAVQKNALHRRRDGRRPLKVRNGYDARGYLKYRKVAIPEVAMSDVGNGEHDFGHIPKPIRGRERSVLDAMIEADQTAIQRAALQEILQTVSERDYEVLILRARGLRLAQIGDRLGLSKERIRQIALERGVVEPKSLIRNAGRRRQRAGQSSRVRCAAATTAD